MTHKKDNLKVGQKVRLINKSKENQAFYLGINSEMEKFLGKEVTVTDINKYNFKIKEDRNTWCWDYKYISKKEEKAPLKVYRGGYFAEDEYLLPYGYSLQKVLVNDRAVICFVEEAMTEAIIKTVAKCQKEDVFDLHKGVEICMYKTLRKIADKKLRRY